ncbi:MAG: zinc ribbon domain-containing protein [Thermomicrobiaceae bacterium]
MEALIARAVQILIALGGAYLVTLWFAIVVWTFQDIQSRSRSVVAQIFSTLVVLIFSIPGLLVYMILRPRYTLDDAFQRSLEEEYLMQDLEELPLCPGCQQYVEDEWVFCPNCRTELRDNCIACDRLIDLRWEICPYCGTEQYADDEDALPAPPAQPIISPSPQYLGRPQLSPTQIVQIASNEEPTRPIIPATVRVDLRSGDILTEQVPNLPLSAPVRQLGGHGESRRVSLYGNGAHEVVEGDQVAEPDTILTGVDELVATDNQTESTDTPAPADAGLETAEPDDSPAPTMDEPEQKSTGSAESGSGNRKRKRRSRRKKSTTTGDGAEETSSD